MVIDYVFHDDIRNIDYIFLDDVGNDNSTTQKLKRICLKQYQIGGKTMNKEQEIKNICKLICATCAQFDGCAINCKAHRDTAETLYNAGYRKIDKNCAVITKAELKEYKKQAVKEFAEKLKAKAYSVIGFDVCKRVYAKEYTINEMDINELLKEYEK